MVGFLTNFLGAITFASKILSPTPTVEPDHPIPNLVRPANIYGLTCRIILSLYKYIYVSDFSHCDEVRILDKMKFNPVSSGRAGALLWRNKPVSSFQEWEELFKDSLGIHFFAAQTNRLEVNDPYRHAYAYLGPKFCPISYSKSSIFHGDYMYWLQTLYFCICHSLSKETVYLK